MNENNTQPMTMRSFFEFMVGLVVVLFIAMKLIDFLWPEKWFGEETAQVTMSAGRLIEAYNNNEVAADNDFKDKWVRISGTVISVEKDLSGDAVVQVGDSEHQYLGVRCKMRKGQYVASFSQGDQISVMGRCTGKLGFVFMEKCEL